MEHELETKQLTLSYGEKAIVKEMDLRIPRGKITVLVGSNGSGKSTLLRGLARLMKPKEGAVYLDSASIVRMSTKEVAKRLGILPQGPAAPEGLTVKELVAQGRYPHQRWYEQWSDDDQTMVEEALELTGMTELADRSLEALSGGQRQKAWIAMTLAQGTRILILDEPTTYLDMAHQVEVLDLLSELQETEGRTIVMVLHDLNQACRYAHHLVAIREGRIFTQGEPSEVISREVIREVFGLDCCVVQDPISDTPMCVPVCKAFKRLEARHQVEALINQATTERN